MLLTFSRFSLRKRPYAAVNEPGLQIQCDSCNCDLTHSIRIKCADPVCEPGDGVDICPSCFCAGKEFAKHKKNHAYRVVVCSDSAPYQTILTMSVSGTAFLSYIC